jgi:predicted DNA-binding antitoxin AbrB/MazE fold protein
MSKSKRKKLRGTVRKVLKPVAPGETEKAEISLEEADELYREIRVENELTDENGEKVSLKPGAEVDVVLEADTNATTKKPDDLELR